MKKNRPSSQANDHSNDSLQESNVNDRYIPLLSSCFIALKNILLYPPDHQQVQHSVTQAYSLLVKELKTQDPLVFGVAKDVLILDEIKIGPGIMALGNFARALSKHGIVSLTFHKGISKESLICFFQLLCDTTDATAGENGIQQELISRGGKHIDLVTVDYHLFQLSEQGGGNTTGITVRKGQRGNIWLTFTRCLLRGGFKGSENGNERHDDNTESNDALDPVQLAHFINKNKLTVTANLRDYGVMLDGILNSAGERGGKGASTLAGEKQSTDSQSLNAKDISMVVTMLDELNPTLRKQFLATTLDKFQGNQDKNNTTQLMSGLSSTLVLEMLDVANEAGRKISPALLSLIQGFSSSNRTGEFSSTSAPVRREIKTLMTSEKYDNYVIPEYDEMLQTLGQSQKQIEPPAGFSLEEHERTMDSKYLLNQITHLILVLIEKTDNHEDYARYGQKLIDIALELPAVGNFTLIDTISSTLSGHSENHPSPIIQELARDCLHRIEGNEYLESIAVLLPEASGQNRILVIQALIARGAKAIPELLDLYCEEKEEHIKAKVAKFFLKYRVASLAEVMRRISGESRDKTLLLLDIIKDLEVGGAAPLLRPILTHHDNTIRMSVLNILLSQQDNDAIQYLRDMLHSSDDTITALALALAAKYKTTALLPDLIESFNYRCLKRVLIEKNTRIILVLGSIADPAAIPSLERLIDSKWFFFPKQIEQMKKALFLSLSSYPVDSVIPLCKKGMKSDQKGIRKICKNILSRAK